MDNETKAMIIAKAIAYAENGGKPKKIVAGKSGEMKSIFQFTPATWKGYSRHVFGKEVPLTNEAEAEVVHHKVKAWLDDGFNTEQIASMWNAGERRPDAYKQNWKGKNKYGVEYDTPAYARKVASYAKSFEKGDTNVPKLEKTPQVNPMGSPTLMGNNQTAMNTPQVNNIGSLIKLAGGQTT